MTLFRTGRRCRKSLRTRCCCKAFSATRDCRQASGTLPSTFQLIRALVGDPLAGARGGIGRGIAAVRVAGVLLVATLALSSLYYFNRDGDWDNWGVYFFGVLRAGDSLLLGDNQRRTRCAGCAC
jgi:hypothetical protein